MYQIDEQIKDLDDYIKNYIDDIYSSTSSNGNSYIEQKEPPVLQKSKSFCIQRENDRVYDNYKGRRNAIEYKRYGQFISLSNDAEPADKRIIDIFDLYNLLKFKDFKIKKQRKSFLDKVKSLFK